MKINVIHIILQVHKIHHQLIAEIMQLQRFIVEHLLVKTNLQKHQKMLLHVWNEIQVRIVQPSRLYVYQKRILETRSGKLIAEAVRHGILPGEVWEELLAYALDDQKYKKLCPFLIWLAWGGMDYIEEKGADENGN